MSTHPDIRLVCGVDSGLATGGLVVIDRAGPRVLDAYNLSERRGAAHSAREQARDLADRLGGWSDLDFLSVDVRARAWVARFSAALDACASGHGAVDCVALESFVDQRQHARQMKSNRWMVPFQTGLLVAELQRRDITAANGRLVYQDAGVVLPQTRDERARLASRARADHDVLMSGDRLLVTEHLRCAFAHALALSIRLDHISTAPALPGPGHLTATVPA